MKFGIFTGPTDKSMRIDVLAPAIEEAGFESLWVPQHSHIPTSRRSPWSGGPELPRGHKAGLDPFVALGIAATVTTSLRLGTGACVVPEHDPIHLAKAVATVDFVSGGRMLFGVGAGWNAEELESHGVDPAHRWDVMADRIAAVKHIWANEEAEYHGPYADFERMWQWPKPVQTPHPPVLVAGQGMRAMRHAAAYGDGWMPYAGFEDVSVAAKAERLNALAAERGRGPLTVTIFGLPVEEGVAEPYMVPEVERLIYRLPPAPASVVLPLLGRAAGIIADLA
jgi:probable F420-dependent oxidoreductase